jgi:hypothetical protein
MQNTEDKLQNQGKINRDAHISVPLTKIYGKAESIEVHTLSSDEVNAVLNNNGYIIVDPLSAKTYILDGEDVYERGRSHDGIKQVFLEEDVIPTLNYFVSQTLVAEPFPEIHCAYYYRERERADDVQETYRERPYPRTLSLDDVTALLKGDEFLVVDPIGGEVFIYDVDQHHLIEKELVWLAEDAASTLDEWSESKVIANPAFDDKPCGYSYQRWGTVSGNRPKEAKQLAEALGLA